MSSASFREMIFGRVYGLSAWAWVVVVCLLVVGTALVPVPVAFTSDIPADAEKVGGFTDGRMNSSATVTYEVLKQDRGGIAVYSEYGGGPNVVWESGKSGAKSKTGIVSYNAESGVFYQSETIRFADGRVWRHTAWADTGVEYHRVEWTDGMRDAEEFRNAFSDNNTDVVVRDTGPTTTVITRTRENYSVAALSSQWVVQSNPWRGLSSDAPSVSPSGDLVTGFEFESGRVQVTDKPGVSYNASFDYTRVPSTATEGLQAVYGDGYVPLIVRVLLTTTEFQGELNRTPGASGIPDDKPYWMSTVFSENASE